MNLSDGQVVFEITADGKKAVANIKDVTKAIESESKKWDAAANNSASSSADAWTGAVGKIAGALTAAGVAAILKEWGSAAIQAASDLEEVQNVVDVTFGESASAIESWSKKAGSAFGLTETQAKRFTSTLGAMMKSAGISDNEIVKMSTDLAGLAADMASFYNLDFDTAFQKVRSGISGETEPLKQLGVNMSVANLEAFALEKGLQKTFSQMTQGEQTMLRYQYIMQATADAQGDFARTSDGYANSARRVENAMNSLKTKGGELLLSVVGPLQDKFASFLESLTAEPERTVLDDFAAIDTDTKSKMRDLENTYGKAKDIIGLIGDIERQTVTLKDGSTETFETLFRELNSLELGGGNIEEYLTSLGLDVDFVTQKYQVWKEALNQLGDVVPGLTKDIYDESNAINSTSAALEQNLEAWRANEEKKIAWSAYYAKERALAEKKGEMYLYEFEAGAAQQALARARANMEELAKTPGLLQHELSWYGDRPEWSKFTGGSYTEEQRAWNDAVDEYVRLRNKAADAEKEYQNQVSDLSEAEQQLVDGKQALIDKYGEEEKAAQAASEATDEFMGKSQDEWKETTSAVNDSIKALNDYVQGVRDATEASVNSTINGFNRLKTAAQQNEEAVNKAQELEKELRESGKYTEKEIEIKVNTANAQITLNSMTEALQSQLDFINEYQENLERARELGVSDNVLAMLSDGSNESARQLHAITEAYKEWDGQGVPEDIQRLNELFQEVSDSKGTFTDTLTQQKLTVDETYDAMVQKAMESIEEMNLAGEAEESLEDTILGMADGINNGVPAVASAVDNILAELNRLSGFGFSFGFDSGGNIELHLDGSNAKGLDYVPFDGYLSELHEGEGILTAEENRIWQRFKAGQHTSANVDYDALGGVMRDNISSGGNVYLDSRIVGQVLSQIQGNQFRSMQRSGFMS